MAVERQHLVSLDGLRGVAAIAVLCSHFENLSRINLHLQSVGRAVDFFFVLSGFVIGQAYEARLAAGLSWRDYIGLRLARLYPAIFGALVVGAALTFWRGDILTIAMAVQFLLLPVLTGPLINGGVAFPLNDPQWSLFWELAINAAHGAVSRWLSNRRLVCILLLSAVALGFTSYMFGNLDVGWSRQSFWGGLPRVVYGFTAGLLIFRADRLGHKAPRVPYLLLMFLLTACMFHLQSGTDMDWGLDLAIVLIVLPVLVALAVQARVPLWLAGIAAWLGALSYPLYAIHTPLLRGFEAILDEVSGPAQTWGWWAAVALTLALAAGFERFYDAPIRKWLAERRRLKTPQAHA